MPVRRTAAAAAAPVAAAPQVVANLLDILNPSAYSGGFNIPEGDYALELIAQMEPPRKDGTVSRYGNRPGVLVVAHPRAGGDAIEQFLSLGNKAKGSWVPTADGKGFAPLAGGPGNSPNRSANWVVFLDSMLQCDSAIAGLGSSLSVLDGTWVHITPMPEPEDRKGFKSKAATGDGGEEEEQQEFKGPRFIPNVTAILEGGKPWLGGGGFGPATPAAPAAPAAAPRRAPVAAAPPVVVAAPVEELAGDNEELIDVVNNALAEVLTKPEHLKGLKRMKLRMEVHGLINAKYDAQTATDALNTFFAQDNALLSVLGPIGYKLSAAGPQADVVPA